MDMLFCRNCGERRSGHGLDFSSAFGAITDAVRADQKKSSPRTAFVLHSVDAVACVLQDMLQLKYGLLLDDADLLGKLRHHCNGQTPEEVVKLFNSQHDLHFRSPGSQRLVSMRLEWTPLTSFEALQAKVRSIPGTSSTVAVVPKLLTEGVDEASKGEEMSCAIAIFREAYSSYPRSLTGRCAGTSCPLISMSSRHFRSAASIEPQILSELRSIGPARKPVECGAPSWREEYSTVVKNEERGFDAPVPKLQLPLQSSRSSRRRSPRRPKDDLNGLGTERSARLTSQCSTEATSPGRPNSPERVPPGIQLGHTGMETPWNLWDSIPGGCLGSAALLGQEPLAATSFGTWPSLQRTPGGLTPPSGLIAPQLTPRHLLPFGGAASVYN